MKKKNIFCVLFCLFMVILGLAFSSQKVFADNKYVKDKTYLVNKSAQNKIKYINEVGLADIDGHPEIAVMVIESTKGESIEDYAQEQFDKYHFGHAGLNNGILLVISLLDHKVRMQTGYGVEAAVPDTFIDDLLTTEVKNELSDFNLSDASVDMVEKLSKRLHEQEDKLGDDPQEANQRKLSPTVINLLWWIFIIIVLLIAIIIFVKKWRRVKAEEIIDDLNQNPLMQHFNLKINEQQFLQFFYYEELKKDQRELAYDVIYAFVIASGKIADSLEEKDVKIKADPYDPEATNDQLIASLQSKIDEEEAIYNNLKLKEQQVRYAIVNNRVYVDQIVNQKIKSDTKLANLYVNSQQITADVLQDVRKHLGNYSDYFQDKESHDEMIKSVRKDIDQAIEINYKKSIQESVLGYLRPYVVNDDYSNSDVKNYFTYALENTPFQVEEYVRMFYSDQIDELIELIRQNIAERRKFRDDSNGNFHDSSYYNDSSSSYSGGSDFGGFGGDSGGGGGTGSW